MCRPDGEVEVSSRMFLYVEMKVSGVISVVACMKVGTGVTRVCRILTVSGSK
jgi:hypothetical protein